MSDPRANVWLRSIECLDAAQKYRDKYGSLPGVNDAVFGLLHTARTLALLASAPADVAADVVAIQVRKAEDEKRARRDLAEVFGEGGAS